MPISPQAAPPRVIARTTSTARLNFRPSFTVSTPGRAAVFRSYQEAERIATKRRVPTAQTFRRNLSLLRGTKLQETEGIPTKGSGRGENDGQAGGLGL